MLLPNKNSDVLAEIIRMANCNLNDLMFMTGLSKETLQCIKDDLEISSAAHVFLIRLYCTFALFPETRKKRRLFGLTR